MLIQIKMHASTHVTLVNNPPHVTLMDNPPHVKQISFFSLWLILFVSDFVGLDKN